MVCRCGSSRTSSQSSSVSSFILIELESQTQDRTPAHWCPLPLPLSIDLVSFTLHLSHRAAEFKISLVSSVFYLTGKRINDGFFFFSVIHHGPFQKYLGKQYVCPLHFEANQTMVEINDQGWDCGFHSLVCFLAPVAWEQGDLTAAAPSCNRLEGRRVELLLMRSGAGLAWTVSFSLSSLSYFMKTQVTFSPTEVFVVPCNHGAV